MPSSARSSLSEAAVKRATQASSLGFGRSLSGAFGSSTKRSPSLSAAGDAVRSEWLGVIMQAVPAEAPLPM